MVDNIHEKVYYNYGYTKKCINYIKRMVNKMKRESIKGNYFYGEKCSDYAIKNGYVDYRTLAKAFDAVLCNDITKLFYNEIGRDFIEPEMVNGYIDNSDDIEQLQNQYDEILEQYKQEQDPIKEKELENKMDEIQEQIEDLEQDNQQEIFQYYFISDAGAEILKIWTDEIVYYIDYLDIYIWGVTHYGTSWDYVLTNIKIEKDGK